MILETSWNSLEFLVENKKDQKCILKLFRSLKDKEYATLLYNVDTSSLDSPKIKEKHLIRGLYILTYF